MHINDKTILITPINSFSADRQHSRICLAGNEQPNGSYESEDSTTTNCFKWLYGQPNGATEYCSFINVTSLRIMWIDRSCLSTSSTSCLFVCEYVLIVR